MSMTERETFEAHGDAEYIAIMADQVEIGMHSFHERDKHVARLRKIATALASRAADVPEPLISERVVESQPDAALLVTRLELTEAGREALTTKRLVQLEEVLADETGRASGWVADCPHCRQLIHFGRPADVPERVSEPLTDEQLINLYREKYRQSPDDDYVQGWRDCAAHEASRVPERVSEPVKWPEKQETNYGPLMAQQRSRGWNDCLDACRAAVAAAEANPSNRT